MKLSWRDIVTAVLAVTGGAVVYAKFYEYTWWSIGSWRGAVATLAVIGAVLFAFSGVRLANRSWANMTAMALGLIALGLAIVGVIMTSQFVFYSLAVVLGLMYLLSLGRHAWNTMHHEQPTSFEHHAPAH